MDGAGSALAICTGGAGLQVAGRPGGGGGAPERAQRCAGKVGQICGQGCEQKHGHGRQVEVEKAWQRRDWSWAGDGGSELWEVRCRENGLEWCGRDRDPLAVAERKEASQLGGREQKLESVRDRGSYPP